MTKHLVYKSHWEPWIYHLRECPCGHGEHWHTTHNNEWLSDSEFFLAEILNRIVHYKVVYDSKKAAAQDRPKAR